MKNRAPSPTKKAPDPAIAADPEIAEPLANPEESAEAAFIADHEARGAEHRAENQSSDVSTESGSGGLEPHDALFQEEKGAGRTLPATTSTQDLVSSESNPPAITAPRSAPALSSPPPLLPLPFFQVANALRVLSIAAAIASICMVAWHAAADIVKGSMVLFVAFVTATAKPTKL